MDEKTRKDFIIHMTGKRGLALRSVRVYLSQFDVFLRHVGLYDNPEKVTNEIIVNYLSEMKIDYKKNANTRRLAKTAIESFYKWFSSYANIENPATELAPIKKYINDPRFVTPDELEIMLKVIDERQKNADIRRRNCAIIALLADTGIRIEEFEKLRTGDVNIVRNSKKEVTNLELNISAVKGSHARVVPFARLTDGDLCSEYFIRYYTWVIVEKKQAKDKPLFWHLKSSFRKEDTNKFLFRTGVRGVIERSVRDASIEKHVTPHMFRHFYGTYSYINGMDLVTIQHFMGHARLSTTMQYIHVAERVAGIGLSHSATAGLKAPKDVTGFSKIFRSFLKR